MVRYHPYARRRLRKLFWQWVRADLVRTLAFVVGAIVLIAFETSMLLILDLDDRLRWYLVGLVPAVIVALAVGGLFSAFLAHVPEAIWQLRGAWAEDFTRDELARARRKKLIWGWVDSVTVQTGDVDHLVVTRSGGLIAIDTKWRSGPDLDPAGMAAEAQRARRRAEGVLQTLLQRERGSHRAAAASISVSPLVVVWGAAARGVPDTVRVAGVDFVAGRSLVSRLGTIAGETVDEAAAADVLARLETYRAESWDSLSTPK